MAASPASALLRAQGRDGGGASGAACNSRWCGTRRRQQAVHRSPACCWRYCLAVAVAAAAAGGAAAARCAALRSARVLPVVAYRYAGEGPGSVGAASLALRARAKYFAERAARFFSARVGFSGAKCAGTVYLRPHFLKVTYVCTVREGVRERGREGGDEESDARYTDQQCLGAWRSRSLYSRLRAPAS